MITIIDNKDGKENKHCAILPGGIKDSSQLLTAMYHQMSVIRYLYGKHPFIPDVDFLRLSLQEILSRNNEFLPEKDMKIANVNDNSLKYPVPFFLNNNICLYTDIKDLLIDSNYWLEQLVDFFIFLNKQNIQIQLTDNNAFFPEDFLFNQSGEILYLVNYHSLIFRTNYQENYNNNIIALAKIIDTFCRYDRRLYNNQVIDRIYGRLIKPIFTEGYSYYYSSLNDLKLDINNNLITGTKKKRIGVFLDSANVLLGMGADLSNIKIDFHTLVKSIYEKNDIKNIKRVAVVFYPVYNNDDKTNAVWRKMDQIKNYLIDYGFQVYDAINGKSVAKEYNEDGRENDCDDQILIEAMEKSIFELDSILLLSGDGHFYNILKKYFDQGKDIKIIALNEDSTNKILIENFETDYLINYYDSIEF